MPRRIYAVISDDTFQGVLARVREDKQTYAQWDMAHALAALAKAYDKGIITVADLAPMMRAYDDAQDESATATGRRPHLSDIE